MIRVAFFVFFIALVMSVALGHRVSKRMTWVFLVASCFGSGVLAYLFMSAGVEASTEQDDMTLLTVLYSVAPLMAAFLPLGIAGLWYSSLDDNEEEDDNNS